MRVEGAPLPAFEEAATTSGSGADSPACLRSARRGAEPALISNFGRAGPLVVVAMFSSAGRCSRFGRSRGVGSVVAGADLDLRGRRVAKVFSLISMRGRAGAVEEASSTILGMLGRNFGAVGGAAGLTRVWRGCVGLGASV